MAYSDKTPLEKAQYTNETKSQIITALNSKGFGIESTDSFRDVAGIVSNNTNIIDTSLPSPIIPTYSNVIGLTLNQETGYYECDESDECQSLSLDITVNLMTTTDLTLSYKGSNLYSAHGTHYIYLDNEILESDLGIFEDTDTYTDYIIRNIPSGTHTIRVKLDKEFGRYYEFSIKMLSINEIPATIDSIDQGKTAYVNGQKLIGTSTKIDTTVNPRELELTYTTDGDKPLELNQETGYWEWSGVSSDGHGYLYISFNNPKTIDAILNFKDKLEHVDGMFSGVYLDDTYYSWLSTMNPDEYQEFTVSGISAGSHIIKIEIAQYSRKSTSVGNFEIKMLPVQIELPITANTVLEGNSGFVNGQKVTGTYIPLDTSDADAAATDIAYNKTAYVNGQKVTGNVTVIGSSSSVGSSTISKGSSYIGFSQNKDYLIRTGGKFTATNSSLATAIELTSDKLVAGNTILGIQGNSANVNTSDADAAAANIDQGKTAYVNGEKITGTSTKIDTTYEGSSVSVIPSYYNEVPPPYSGEFVLNQETGYYEYSSATFVRAGACINVEFTLPAAMGVTFSYKYVKGKSGTTTTISEYGGETLATLDASPDSYTEITIENLSSGYHHLYIDFEIPTTPIIPGEETVDTSSLSIKMLPKIPSYPITANIVPEGYVGFVNGQKIVGTYVPTIVNEYNSIAAMEADTTAVANHTYGIEKRTRPIYTYTPQEYNSTVNSNTGFYCLDILESFITSSTITSSSYQSLSDYNNNNVDFTYSGLSLSPTSAEIKIVDNNNNVLIDAIYASQDGENYTLTSLTGNNVDQTTYKFYLENGHIQMSRNRGEGPTPSYSDLFNDFFKPQIRTQGQETYNGALYLYNGSTWDKLIDQDN